MPFNSGQFQSGLMRKITLLANEFVETMKSTIDEVNAPKKIKEHISIGKAEKQNNKISIEVSIDTSKDAAIMAPAYEWGSGEHATRGSAGRYKIEGNPLLAIPRSRWESYQPPPDVDPVILPYVMHPGVQARPFITPTIKKILPKMKQELSKTVKAELLVGVKRVTVISA